MVDDIIASPETPTNTQENQIPVELAQMMELSLNGPKAPDPAAPPVGNDANGNPIPPAAPAVVPDVFTPFKEKFGYQTAEDAMKEIEELRALKANPPTTQEFKYENDESKKMALAIQKGDRKTVLDIWAKQEKLEALSAAAVSKENAAEIIKMAMKVENDELEQHEIDFQYNEQYTAPKEPKEPVQRTSETDEEFEERKGDWQERHDDWKQRVASIETKISIAAKMAKPKLEAAKSKIVLPEIETNVDEDYIQYRKMLEDRPKQDEALSAEYKSFTPKSIESKVKFIDEANKIDFEFQYEPDSESFNKAVEMVQDGELLQKHFQGQDGKPDRKRFLEAIYFGLNKEKILLEAIKQSKNATIKAFLPDNISGPQRQFPQTQEPSELDKLMQQSLSIGQRR